ncbi:MAG: glycoside hydrolase family 2 protein, partial [Prevotella sp.]|nr:glycoside hydrolase family 2 protein [Prevotella sp.]
LFLPICVKSLNPSPVKARYVRIFIPKTGRPQRFALSEVEVMGRGGIVVKPHEEVGWNAHLPTPITQHPPKYFLDGGDWRLQRASEVAARGAEIASPDFDASSWTVATVPATVLMSYVNAGALPNPNYDDNLLGVSESFFNSNFWYRREFRVPQEMRGQRVFLNFDGINWKADIWLNGQKIDRIEGAFMRGKTDVTRYLHDGVNVLAVEIEKCANPGGAKLKNEQTTDFNGGVLGADNPTFHATVGWDWISTIRGRDIGIWNDVYLTSTANDVTLSDPFVNSKVTINGGDTLATMLPNVIVKNYSENALEGTLQGWIGDIKFEKTVALAANEEREINFHPNDFPQLREQKLKLWWPNGYGEPNLYDAGFTFSPNTHQPSTITYQTGIREITYAEVDTRLQIFVNGQRFVPLGGNWGFSENNLCYRGREYDAAVRYHREMNLNCIRNWVGQTGDREFYEACDRHGIMIWQDFWLANPVDGPNPDDDAMFLKNARDYVLRIRQHPSIMLYCGRNEGYPPKAIDNGLRQLVSELTGGNTQHPTPNTYHPTPLLYISSSADDGVSGHGPYWAIPAREYFEKQTGKLHTERGMPNIMTYEGLSRTLRPEHLWPQNEYWGQHDFTQQGAQRGASFNSLISKGFGEPKNACEFTTIAQWQNYDGYRAMYESTNHDRQGLLIWMSHPTWPSMVWQTYDYYFEPTAAYFGTKKACEPLHVQWNSLTDSVEIVNRTAFDHKLLTVEARLFDKNGRELACEDHVIDVNPDETRPAMPIPSLTSLLATEKVGFLRLRLTNAANETLSENTYICGAETGNYQALKELPQAELNIEKSTLRQAENGTISCMVTLENRGQVPAVMLRLNLKAADGDQILPVIYSDNYFHLLPNEKRSVEIEWNRRDARGQQAVVEVSGYNVSLSNNRIE